MVIAAKLSTKTDTAAILGMMIPPFSYHKPNWLFRPHLLPGIIAEATNFHLCEIYF
jgi:hypothetical protein